MEAPFATLIMQQKNPFSRFNSHYRHESRKNCGRSRTQSSG
jgi:hypothetical protein